MNCARLDTETDLATTTMVRQWVRRGHCCPPGMTVDDVSQQVWLVVRVAAGRWRPLGRPRSRGRGPVTLREWCHVKARHALMDLCRRRRRILDHAESLDSILSEAG